VRFKNILTNCSEFLLSNRKSFAVLQNLRTPSQMMRKRVISDNLGRQLSYR